MDGLSHLDEHGQARMVDVGAKAPTRREATATARVRLGAETVRRIREGSVGKGDALAVARVAGILAAKRTADLIPLCHPLPLDSVSVEIALEADAASILARAAISARTGVEMEAMTAAAVAALALYDMVKGLDRSAEIVHVRLESKSGGTGGDYVRGL